MSSALAWAQEAQPTTDQKIQQLQQKVDELEKAIKADEAAVNGQDPGTATADYPNGFTVRSKDGNFVLRIGADLQIDNRTYYGTGATGDTDAIVIRRARPTLLGTVYKYVDFFVRPDFGQGTTALYDAYIQLNYIPWFQIRAGKFKTPLGLERLQNDDDTSFVERGLPTLLVPQRDVGYQVGGICSTIGSPIRSARSTACPTARSAPTPRSAIIAIMRGACFSRPSRRTLKARSVGSAWA